MRAPFDLMVVIDPRTDGALDAMARLSEHVRGERLAIQLRAKDASEAEVIALAARLAAVMPAMSRLLVNGSTSVAGAIAADGVHLPERSGTVTEARAALSAGALVGASVHDAAGAATRATEGADYLVLGPLGEVPGKPAIDGATFARIAAASTVPVVALGGIASAADADRATALGASGIAVERALFDGAWMARWLAGRIGA